MQICQNEPVTLCMLGNFSFFYRLLSFFKINFLKTNFLGTLSKCQTVSIQIRTEILSVLIWVKTVCKGVSDSADGQRKALKSQSQIRLPGLKVIKLEYILRLKIKRNDWLIVDTCPQAANHYALF